MESILGITVDLLTSRQVARRLSISIRTVWRMTARGELPAPIRFNRKLVRWKAAEITRHVQAMPSGQPAAYPRIRRETATTGG